jgi:hypothetical protein
MPGSIANLRSTSYEWARRSVEAARSHIEAEVRERLIEEVRVLLRLDWQIDYLESIDLTEAGEHTLSTYQKVKEVLDHLEERGDRG